MRPTILLVFCGGCIFLGSVNCIQDDPTHQSTSKRSFDDIRVAGYYGDITYTNGCDQSERDIRLSLLLLDQEGNLIKPNDQLSQMKVEPGNTFTSDDIQFPAGAKFYPLTDMAVDITCTDASECPGDGYFGCEDPNPEDMDTTRVCVKTGLDITLDNTQGVVFSAGTGRQKAIALVMDYSGSLAGKDENGIIHPEDATDPEDMRISSATSFVILVDKSSYNDARIALYSFQETGLFGVKQDVPFTQNHTAIENEIIAMQNDENGKSPLWEAVTAVAEDLREEGDRDLYMVLFTDGYADGSEDRQLQDAIDSLASGGTPIKFFMIHLDSNNVPASQIGPQDEFKQLACESGGYYYYTKSASELGDIFRTISIAIEGTWDVTIRTPVVDTLPVGWYAIETSIEVRLGTTKILSLYEADGRDSRFLLRKR